MLWGLTGINELPTDIIERQTITILLVWYCYILEFVYEVNGGVRDHWPRSYTITDTRGARLIGSSDFNITIHYRIVYSIINDITLVAPRANKILLWRFFFALLNQIVCSSLVLFVCVCVYNIILVGRYKRFSNLNFSDYKMCIADYDNF
jgi:hypothetical protein